MQRCFVALTSLALIVSISRADEEPAPSKVGSLSGRFVYDGMPPERQPLALTVERRTLTGKPYRAPDIERFQALKLTDDSLIVGPDRGIQNIIVWIANKVDPVPVTRRLPEPVTVTFKDGQWQPRVLAWWGPSRMLRLKNDDPVSNNLQWFPGRGTPLNVIIGPGKIHNQEILEAEKIPSRAASTVYPELAPAILFPCPNPHVTVTNKEGYFELKELPAGDWEFRAWHERCGWVKTDLFQKGRLQLQIDGQAADLGSIKVAPALFETKPDKPAPTTSATSRKPDAKQDRPGWKELGDQRKAAHEKDGGKEWVGTWIMRLPAGFEHEVRIAESDDGVLKLDADKNLNSLGTYAFIKNQLVLIRPNDESSTDDFVWQLNDEGMFVLITDRNRAGARYIGAVLEKPRR